MKIIAEIGINHNGDFRYMQELIRQAALGGADYAKFQLYNSRRVFGDDSRKQNEFTLEQVRQLQAMCAFYGIEFLASVFDEQKVEWCEQLGVKEYKIASRTAAKEPALCESILKLNKPTLVSLGFWQQAELPFATYPNVRLLNCISKYPTTCFDYQPLRRYSERVVGLSDHSYGIAFCLYHIAHGATVIEKHFTLNKSMPGNDHIGSMDLAELRSLREHGDQVAAIAQGLSKDT